MNPLSSSQRAKGIPPNETTAAGQETPPRVKSRSNSLRKSMQLFPSRKKGKASGSQSPELPRVNVSFGESVQDPHATQQIPGTPKARVAPALANPRAVQLETFGNELAADLSSALSRANAKLLQHKAAEHADTLDDRLQAVLHPEKRVLGSDTHLAFAARLGDELAARAKTSRHPFAATMENVAREVIKRTFEALGNQAADPAEALLSIYRQADPGDRDAVSGKEIDLLAGKLRKVGLSLDKEDMNQAAVGLAILARTVGAEVAQAQHRAAMERLPADPPCDFAGTQAAIDHLAAIAAKVADAVEQTRRQTDAEARAALKAIHHPSEKDYEAQGQKVDAAVKNVSESFTPEIEAGIAALEKAVRAQHAAPTLLVQPREESAPLARRSSLTVSQEHAGDDLDALVEVVVNQPPAEQVFYEIMHRAPEELTALARSAWTKALRAATDEATQAPKNGAPNPQAAARSAIAEVLQDAVSMVHSGRRAVWEAVTVVPRHAVEHVAVNLAPRALARLVEVDQPIVMSKRRVKAGTGNLRRSPSRSRSRSGSPARGSVVFRRSESPETKVRNPGEN